ncbi:hypothetical protein C7E20_11535 [Sphingobium sp. AEW4]|nr:hypothetical protein C7E20_11535 [Sphingobium sp. AEW4]
MLLEEVTLPINKGKIRSGGYFTANTRFRLGTRPPEIGDDRQHRLIYDAMIEIDTFDRGQMLAVIRDLHDLRPRAAVDAVYCRTQIRSMFECGYIDLA